MSDNFIQLNENLIKNNLKDRVCRFSAVLSIRFGPIPTM
jgi:hypothetical protein